ncbi:MAG: PHP domain-containing protein, partial [Clostridia bacterium]
ITQMREKYGDKIEILFGGEIGYDNELQADFREIVAKYPFDYIINSVHLVYGEDAWLMPFYENKTKKQAYDLYLDQVYDSVCGNYPYDIVGHIGYVIRRIPYEDKSMGMEEFGEKIDKILKKIIRLNKTLEINTNTRGMCDILPLIHVIERYVELGGWKFSYGSDAHDLERLYDQEDKVKAILKSLGIDKTVCYRNGIEYFESL